MNIDSYLSWMGQWMLTSGLKIFFIMILMVVGMKVADVLSTKIFDLINRRESDMEYRKRVQTLSSVIRYILTIGITVVSMMMILKEFGVDIGPIIAAAGVVGLAVGFGAQNLVQDVISGFFILLEDQIRVGDVVNIAGKGGLVEKVTLRMIILRDFDGSVSYIRNGKIDTVTNLTKDFSYYVFDVNVSYKEDVDQVTVALREIDEEIRKDPNFASLILSPLEVYGIDHFADTCVVIKARIKTVPIRQWDVGREMNGRIKKKFEKLNIQIFVPEICYLVEENKNNPSFESRGRRDRRQAPTEKLDQQEFEKDKTQEKKPLPAPQDA